MPQKIKYYIILTTGFVVCLVGLINFFTNYGLSNFMGIVNQITAVILVIGGCVNLIVATQIKQDMARREGEISARREVEHTARRNKE
jgi:putative Mn2+ efflux pump MntP